MDRLDGLLGSRSGPREGEPNSGGPSREPKVNFNDHQRRRTYGSTRGRGSSSGYTTRDHRTWGPNSRASSSGNRQTSNERPTQGTHATGRGDSSNRRNASPGRSHVGQGETLTAIRVAGMHRKQSLRQGVRTLRRDTQGMLRQWPHPLNP